MWNRIKTYFKECDGENIIWGAYTFFGIIFFVWGFNFITSLAA